MSRASSFWSAPPTSSVFQAAASTLLNGGNVPGGATRFITPWGINTGTTTTESIAQQPAPFALTATKMQCFVRTYTASTASMTCALAINGVATTVIVTIPAGSAGTTVSITGQAVAVAAGDLLSLQLTKDSGGTVGVESIAVAIGGEVS